MKPSYVELHASSSFSFLRGASPPEQLAVTRAQFEALTQALTDRTLAAVRKALRDAKLEPEVVAELLRGPTM